MNNTRFERGSRLVMATHDTGKLAEFKALMAPFGITVLSAGELGLPGPEETATSFAGNAAIKAQVANLPALETRSFAEMSDAEKNAISHRARAFEAFRAACLA
jgi:inosine/xanthosine triphosphate pyrophosphatase family protein